jgi:arylsulfatase A-like enzyme
LYTDRFISELNVVLTRLNVADKTIFCVIGDHGEAFGEHGLLGHERIAYDEVLRIPWVIRAPFLVEPGRRVTQPVSTIDLTPTLLSLLGFDIATASFDGADGLGSFAGERKVYFSGWLQQSPAGFVRENRKFIYNPSTGEVSVYDMRADPFELVRMEVPGERGQKIADEIISWRKSSIFRLNQQQSGRKRLFDVWNCRWNNRVCSAKYRPKGGN